MFYLHGTKDQPWTRNKVLFIAFIARVTLILYSNIHDYIFNVNFTDIDYSVFSDAAHHVAQGRSPFERATYRYTPALAWILLPNERWKDFGKLLFCLADVFVGWLCFAMYQNKKSGLNQKTTESKTNRSSSKDEEEFHDEAIFPVVVFWLANPLIAVISARGNADVLVCASVLFTLYLLRNGNWLAAALVHGGLAVHLKIYPLIYLPSIFLHLAKYSPHDDFTTQFKKFITNAKGFIFAVISCAVFCGIVFFFYQLYGKQFLDEFLLYHIRRRDIRHNFSPYFYLLYLVDNEESLSKLVGALAFLPQLISTVVFAFRFSNDLPFCWFVTTFAFVSFNKVCTSQYFVWYIVFMPLLTNVHMEPKEMIRLICIWFASQALWLFPAYLFEFRGIDTFIYIWLASLIFLAVNGYIIRRTIQCYVALDPKLKVA